jgi:hypothetical protein
VAERWKLTLRRGPKVTIERFPSRETALQALDAALRDAWDVDRLPPTRVFHREIEPAARVALRAELAGPQRWLPRVHVGIDVRGDGSQEPFTGRVNRTAVERRPGEDTVQALRRVVAGG